MRARSMRAHLPTHEWRVSGGAALIAAMIHAVLIAPLVLGSARHRPPLPDQFGAGASARIASSEVETAMTLVDLQQSESIDESPLEEIASAGIELPKFALMIASPQPTFAAELDEDAIEDRTLTEAAGDTSGHAAMFGRYIGQINARIERAWTRPRDPLEHGHFSCQTKIEQDAHGKVVSVELRHCSGSVSWQQSLVSAIEHASPLPSPPIPSVFAKQLVLSFSADAFQPGISDERAYQPDIRVAAAENGLSAPASEVSTESPASQLASFHGAIHLKIEGKNVTWTLAPAQESQSDTTEMANIVTSR